MCIHGTISTGVETLRARVEYNMARGAGEFCSEWKLSDFGNNEFSCFNDLIELNGATPLELKIFEEILKYTN